DFVHLETLQFGRRQRVIDEILDVGIPANDVHLLVVQLANDVLDALTAQADAGADGVDLLIAGPDGQLGAEAGFARNAFDLDGVVADLGDFELEQLDNEAGIGAGKNDFRAMRALFDGFDVAT